jgi:glycine cleavage system pyridoxal-binding protein P
MPEYDELLKESDDCQVHNIKKRRNDLMRGMYILSHRSTGLTSISTAYHYITIYDRFKNNLKNMKQPEKILKSHNFAALFLAYKMDEMELKSIFLSDYESRHGIEKTWYQQVLEKYKVCE